MREEIKLIVFDWAGTTVDYGCIAPLAVFERIFENKNIHLTREAILKPMGMGKRDHIETLLATEDATRQWKEQYQRDWTQADIDEMFAQFNVELLRALKDYCTPIDGVLESVAELRRMGLHIGSTTGYTREMMDIVEKGAKELGYAPDYMVTSEMTNGFGRPYPYMLYENMKHFEVSSIKSVVKVGDTVADIKEGKNAGAWSIGVVEGSSIVNMTLEMAASMSDEEKEERFVKAEETMKNAGADYVIRTMRELPKVIEEINRRMQETIQ